MSRRRFRDRGSGAGCGSAGGIDPVCRLSGLGRSAVTFATAAGKSGIGTQSRLLSGAEPIEGAARLTADNDLTLLDIRLAPNDQRLVDPILSRFSGR